MEGSAHNHNHRRHSNKLFSGGQNGYCSGSDDSDGDPDGNLSRHCEEDEDIMNQYERIGDRTSGTSTGSSGLSHHHHQQQQQQQNQQQQQHPTQQPPKATHYAESAIYKRSRGYPSPDSEAATLPASYVPQPATQYLLNRVGVGVGSGVNSGEPWSQSSAGCHTLERNIDSNSKNNNKIISNNLLSSSVHHLLSSSMAPDNINTSCGPLIDTQRGGEYDSATTCLVRTQSGSLFIPSDGHKGIVGNPLQGGNDFDALVSGHHHHHHTMAPIIKSDTGKSINAERPPILSSNHLPLIPGRIGSRGGPISVRKTLSSHCSWKCTAITFMLLSVALLIAVCYFMGIFLSGDSDGHHVCPVMMVETELNPESSERKTPVASRIRGRREPSSQHVHDSDNDDSDGGRDKDDINEDAIVKEDPSFTSSFSSPLTPSSGEVHGLHVSQTETSTKSTLSPIAGEISDAWAPVVHERSSSEEDRVLAHNDNGGSTSVDLNTNSGKDFFVVMHAPSVPSPSSSSSVKTQTNTVPKTNPSSAALISQRLHEENNPTKLLPDDNYLNPKAVNPVINTNDLSSNGGRRRESSESQSLDRDGHVESKQGDDYSNDDRVGRGNSDESSHLLSSQENAGDTEKGKEEDIGQEAKSGTLIDPKETKGVNDANRLPVSTSSGSGNKLIGSKNWHSNDSGSLQLTEKLNQPGIELGESFRQRTSSQDQTLHQQDKHFSSNDDREKQMQKDGINASRTDSVALKAEDELLITTVISDNLGGAVEDVIDTKEMRTETQVETKQYLLENNDQKSLDFIESTVDPRLEERGMNSEKTISKDENDGVKARDADGSRLKTTDGLDGLKYTEGTEIFSTISSMDLDRTDNTRIRNENNDNGKMDDVWLNPLSAAPSMKDESGSLQTLQDDPSSFVTTSNFNFETNNNNFLIKSNSGPKTVVSNNVNPSAVGDGRKLEEAKFMEIELGKKHTQRVPSYGHWNVQLFQTEPTLVKFNYTIPVGVSVGIYGGKNRIPSHTKYDFMEVIGSGTGPARASRSNSLASNYGLPPSRKVQVSEFIQFLDKGTWYIVMYNDASQPQEISFITLVADESNMRCPYSCSGHGNCVMGTCKCDVDYTGDACEYRVCPILCSGRGKYNKGQCVCNTGWKGKECELREDECEVSDCSGHGDCVDGICHCFPGYKGQHCEEVDCLDPDCSNHGTCVNGLCLCGKGWKGAHCNEPDSNALRCLPDCSGHGSFDLDLQQCICDSRWTGTDCSQERCDLDCGPNGHCQSNECVCAQGWTGPKCEERFCDPRCLEHGQCKNGTCLCHQGWNGKHCTLEGCPRSCNNKGECVGGDNEWECECNPNWAGHDCSIPLEKDCSDKKDNDNDGLIDCADSECCGSKECQNNPLCFSSADPLDILLRKQPPSPTASFFQRMQFLIEEDSVQSYAHKQAFNDSRASVIRGQVKSPSGSGLMGVRVGIASEPLLGFVVSRETGWFDIMVNGGSAVTLHFQREPFRPTQRTVMVPWNEIVVIDKVKMNVDERKLPDYRSPICVEHDYDLMRPVILGAWKHGFQGGCNDEKGHVSESTVVQESIQIPASNVHLVYHSSRAGGYLSTFDMQLTPDKVPPSLRQIHVKIGMESKECLPSKGLRYRHCSCPRWLRISELSTSDLGSPVS